METFISQPSPTPSTARVPASTGLETVGAIGAIVLALAAAILGYRILRGGRGL